MQTYDQPIHMVAGQPVCHLDRLYASVIVNMPSCFQATRLSPSPLYYPFAHLTYCLAAFAHTNPSTHTSANPTVSSYADTHVYLHVRHHVCGLAQLADILNPISSTCLPPLIRHPLPTESTPFRRGGKSVREFCPRM